MAADKIIDIQHVYFKYPKSPKHTLEDIHFAFEPKTLNVISGPSGSGKSSLLKILIGLVPHSIEGLYAGNVFIDGENSRDLDVGSISKKVGCVFQNPEFQLYESEVRDEFPFREYKPDEIDHPMFHILDMKKLYYRKISELSSGEKQKVAITSILVRGQEILIMDEPLATLDHDSCERLIDSLVKLRDETGRTIIVIEHRWKQLAPHADKIVWIVDGKVKEIQEKPIKWEDNPFELKEEWKNQDKQIGNKVVEFTNVHCKRGTKWILQDINLHIDEREIVGLVGPNGAGKSTLSFLLAGVLKAKKGVISISGKKPKSGKGNVGISFQNPTHQLFMQTVENEVQFAQHNYKKKYEFSVEDYLELLNIKHLRNKISSDISFGEQRRTAFASSLSYEPSLIILDEPTTGLDDKNILKIIDFVYQMRELGRTFLIVSHDSRFIDAVCDRIIQIKDGRIVAC